MYKVQDLYSQHGNDLELELVAGANGLDRPIRVAEVHRPGLSLSGYVKGHAFKRLLVFGKVEVEYLRSLEEEMQTERLKSILHPELTPAVIIARRYRPPKALQRLCNHLNIPLFRANSTTMRLLNRLTVILASEFAPSVTCHGTLVEVFGVGVMIQGNSSVGKSEAALGLIERGHRLISDDIVKVIKREDSYLEGFGAELTRHHMEIRGIGIINVAYLYGVVCVRDHKSIDIVVRLEAWDDMHFYDRVGLDENFVEILGVQVPMHILPVKPGRNVELLVETLSLNHRLHGMGYNSAQEFTKKLLRKTADPQRLEVLEELTKRNENGAG